jgi:hypothetical protein
MKRSPHAFWLQFFIRRNYFESHKALYNTVGQIYGLFNAYNNNLQQ